jgi:hypothetical protein
MTASREKTPRPIFADIRAESLRGRAGFFRVGQAANGTWWLLTPEDEPVLLRAVAGVNRHGRAGPAPVLRSAYARTVERLYGPGSEAWERSTATRLHSWGVDTVGPWADGGLVEKGFYFTAQADFCRARVALIHGPGVRLPDVFDTLWPAAAEAHAAAVTAPWTGRRELVGWFTDDALGWGAAEGAGGPTLLQVCLSLEPALAAHHAAWEFVLAGHGGGASPEIMGKAWGIPLQHRQHMRQWTREGRAVGGAVFAEDALRFAKEAARRYFHVVGAALRRYDREHLVLGCRFATPPPKGVRLAAAWPDMDVASWRLHAGGFQAQAAAGSGEGNAMPQWVTGGGLSHGDFRALPVRDGTGPTRLERLLRAGREGMVAACRDPRTVGIEWAHWADGTDDAPPFGSGLVHADDHEAVEHTELLGHVHARAEALHVAGPLRSDT